jgi:hypothetical protein
MLSGGRTATMIDPMWQFQKPMASMPAESPAPVLSVGIDTGTDRAAGHRIAESRLRASSRC